MREYKIRVFSVIQGKLDCERDIDRVLLYVNVIVQN